MLLISFTQYSISNALQQAHSLQAVIAQMGYGVDGALQNTGDSVFCSHGAAELVHWDQWLSRMHLPSVLVREERFSREPPEDNPAQARAFAGGWFLYHPRACVFQLSIPS